MNRLIILFSAIILVACNSSTRPEFNTNANAEDAAARLVGTWESIDTENEAGSMRFSEEGYAWFGAPGAERGGPRFTHLKHEVKMVYEVNTDTEPWTLDLHMDRLDSNIRVESHLGIFEYQSNGVLQVCLNFQGTFRPENFVDEGPVYCVFLKKALPK